VLGLPRLHHEDYDSVMNSILVSYRNLTVWEHEYRVMLPDRETRWLHGGARPERLEDGSVLWHGYITDVTDRVCANREV
jgi:PAS domain-containing protein